MKFIDNYIMSNQAPRGHHVPQATVIHYTVTRTAAAALNWFKNPAAKASAHYIVDKDGTVIRVVPVTASAYAVGRALLSNENTVSIEVVNLGWLDTNCAPEEYVKAELLWPDPHVRAPSSRPCHWEPFTNSQYDAVHEILGEIAATFPSAVKHICGHCDIALPCGRKVDPGPLFDYARVATPEQLKAFHITRSNIINT